MAPGQVKQPFETDFASVRTIFLHFYSFNTASVFVSATLHSYIIFSIAHYCN